MSESQEIIEKKPKRKGKMVRCPIHGYIRLSDLERQILDSAPVQRMRRLRQLAGSEYVYPGANHTRLEHCIGAMYLAGELGSELLAAEVNIEREDIRDLRLAALMHDIGHGPFSHLFEAILEKLDKTHEDLSIWLIQDSEIAGILEEYGIDVQKQSQLSVGRRHADQRPFISEIIASAIDVDKQDFVIRDSFHTGATYGVGVDIARLNRLIDVLDNHLAVDIRALSVLETFIIARIQSFRSIYFHTTARAAQIMISLALESLYDEGHQFGLDSVEDYLKLDDYTMWGLLAASKAAEPYVEALRKRKLLKCAYETYSLFQSSFQTRVLTSEATRKQVQQEIAEETGLDQTDVHVDVPTVPSVPSFGGLAVRLFRRSRRTGELTQRSLQEESRVIRVLEGIFAVTRVYSSQENREKVGKAATKVFGAPSYTERISS
ncbi:MAG: HD domain-containing protein [Candidatus Hodarchaeales archaeon]|jgi:HD superfamily phosphohydrolase